MAGGIEFPEAMQIVNIGPAPVLANPTCRALPDLPTSVRKGAGAMVNGKPLVCNGQYALDCYLYDKDTDEWNEVVRLDTQRTAPASVQLENGDLWVMGGRKFNFGERLTTTDIYRAATVSVDVGPEMPVGLEGACAVRVNATHVLVVGGATNGGERDNPLKISGARMYDFGSEEWVELTPMSQPRMFHGCGLFEAEGEQKVMVVGGEGESTTEIYDVATDSWTDGPLTPYGKPFSSMSVVQYGRTFVILGGMLGDDVIGTDQIFEYNVRYNGFVERKEKIPKATQQQVALVIDENAVDC